LAQALHAYVIAKTANSAALHLDCLKGYLLASFDADLQQLIEAGIKLDDIMRRAIAAYTHLRYWTCTDRPLHSREQILPSGTVELVVNLVDHKIRIYDSSQTGGGTRF
jgi:hypothetical protein